MTKTGAEGTAASAAVVEELDELGALALGEAAHRLRLTDAALVQVAAAARRTPERPSACRKPSRSTRTRAEQDVSICVPRFQVALELRASDADVVRTLERLHPLIERAGRRLRVRLRRDHHESDESTKPTLVKL